MKTIGDFKEAGLEISKNDVIDGVTRDKNSAPLKLVELLNKDYDFNDAWTIREFAWRHSVRDQPTFNGTIEVVFMSGVNLTLRTSSMRDSDWKLISRWRPLLNQEIPTETPEEKAELDRIFGEASGDEEKENKPIYTQEMQERGELLVVGMEVMAPMDILGDKLMRGLVVYIGQSFGKQACVVQCENWLQVFKPEKIKPIDTRTPEEKADDLFKIYLKGEEVFTHKTFSQAVIDGDFGDNIIWAIK